VIRWEEQPDGNWLGYSGQALVATATKADEKRWDWEVPGAGKPKGWRNSGHRTNELDARRAADAYWDKWLGAAALKPDLGRLAEASVPSKPRKGEGAGSVAGPKRSRRQAHLDRPERRECQARGSAAEARPGGGSGQQG
jgi:hypothetical protein